MREADTVDDAGAREAARSGFVRDGEKLGRDRIELNTRVVVSSHVTSTDCYRVFQYSSKGSCF